MIISFLEDFRLSYVCHYDYHGLIVRYLSDFVVYLGDVVTANNVGIANASLYWDQAISPTRDRGIPWATVFGNHDDAHFEWPKEWFSRSGVPPLYCPTSDSSYAGMHEFVIYFPELRLQI